MRIVLFGGTGPVGTAACRYALERVHDVTVAHSGTHELPADLPVRQDRHRGYHDTEPAYRDKESKKTYDRFLQRFRGREDLRLRR